jgi:hypothetical protein
VLAASTCGASAETANSHWICKQSFIFSSFDGSTVINKKVGKAWIADNNFLWTWLLVSRQ